MWGRYIGGRVSAGSLGSSLPSPGSRVTGVFVPRLLWATDEKENVGRTVYCGAPAGPGAHNRPPLSEGFSLNHLSDAFNSSRDSKECWGQVAAWTVGKKNRPHSYIGKYSASTPSTPGQLLILSLRGISSLSSNIRRETFLQNTRNPEKTLHMCLRAGYFTYRTRCLRILFIKILSSSRKLPDVIVFQIP